MKLLDSLYYTFYKLSLKTTLKDIAEHVGYMWVSIFLLTNIVVIAKNLGINILQYASAKMASSVICGGIMILLYFLYVKHGRYLILSNKYKAETSKQKSIRISLVFIYVIVTIVALLLL